MELKTFIYEVAYIKEFEGNVNGKRVKSRIITINGNDFIGTESGKAIWVKVSMKGKEIRFSLPVSQMFNVSKLTGNQIGKKDNKTYIKFDMLSGMHGSATWNKKRPDGSRIFKPKRACSNCANYTPDSRYNQKYGGSGSNRGSGRSI